MSSAQAMETVDQSQVQLVAFSERLLHSIQLYFALSRRLSRIRLKLMAAPSWEVETALVESFALHTRGLADFFLTTTGGNNPRRALDAYALHFFQPSSAWEPLLPQVPWLRRVYNRGSRGTQHVDRFGALVAHLNYRDPPSSELARGWPVMQVSHDVGKIVAAFALNVEPSRVDPAFVPAAWREIPALARLNAPGLPLFTWTRPVLRQGFDD